MKEWRKKEERYKWRMGKRGMNEGIEEGIICLWRRRELGEGLKWVGD
ncbi:hypothetical protein [Xanthomonas citri]|nr:hypothetical protein [Xanthomonas citri]UZB06449.1 hypothetical protein OM953_12425 [Xanthomonas citri pv. fuscans]